MKVATPTPSGRRAHPYRYCTSKHFQTLPALICYRQRSITPTAAGMEMNRHLVAAFFVAAFISTCCDAATVAVRREAVDSSFLDDYHNDCEYAGAIHLSHPMSIGKDDRYYEFGSQMLEAAHMTIDQINMWPRCGLSIQDKNYSLILQTYGDESDEDKTVMIGQNIVNATDFMLAGYSSTLTSFIAPIAQENRRLLVTAGSSKTSVFAERDHVFGLLPPGGLYLNSAFEGTKAMGAKTIAYLDEDGVPACEGAPTLAEKYGMEFLEGTTIREFSSLETFEQVARNMSLLDPDVMITCIRTNFQYWNQAMRLVDWTPRAQVYTMVAGTPEFEQALGTDLPYVMGVSAWDRAMPPVPDRATGWTPYEFDQNFLKQAFRRPVYQHTSQSAAISVLVQAIERVGTLNVDDLTGRVRQVIATEYFQTVYGNVSFDENGQSTAPYLFTQYDSNSTLHVLGPEDRSFTDFELVYPIPTWAKRDCDALSICQVTNGTCTSSGTCNCGEPLLSAGVGPTAACIPPKEKGEVINYAAAIAIPIAVSMVAGAALLIYNQKKQRQNDSVWQVKKSELLFADPPKTIGRGTFGLVLLAEYHGTQVAVKRVLPPKTGPRRRNRANGRSSSFDSDDEETASRILSEVSSDVSSNGDSSDSADKSLDGTRRLRQKRCRKLQQGFSRHDFIKEMRCVSKLRHPCITTVMGAVFGPKEEPQLVLEYMEHGSLYDILHNETMTLDEEMLLPILCDISQGCRFLHAAHPQIVHGDLKATNVLVDAKFRAKVADFGISHKKQIVTGTPYWMAPELLRRESPNTTAADVYSFGIVLYEVYSREGPYDGEEDTKEILRQVADPYINRRPPVPKDCPPQLASLMCDCLVANPDDRPSFEEVDKRLKRIEARPTEPKTNDKTTVSLFDIFPKHIAEALQDGKQVEPEHRDVITLFFSDVVGFTELSSSLDPRKVANMLDRLYEKFDSLSHKHGVFKVETVGDCWMGATNLVQNQADDHATRIACFAVETIQAASMTLVDVADPEKGYVNIRVGFHSGPVVADVVGSRNPRYCLFGDTVNVASRMESNSMANRIQCSEDAAEFLRRQNCKYPIKPRGKIEVKGKGKLHTYWVNEAENVSKLHRPLLLDSAVAQDPTNSLFFM